MSNERTRSLISFYEKSAIVEPKLVTDTQTEPVLMSFQRPDNDQSGSINPYDGFAVFDPNATDPRVVAQNNESIQTQPVQSLPPQPQPVQPQPTQPQPVQYTQPEPVQRQPIQPQPVVTPQHETTHEMAQPLPISSTPAPQVVKAPEPTQHNSTEAVNGNMSTPPMHPVKMVDGRTDNGEVVNPTVKMDPQTASTLPVSERKEAIYDHTNGKPEPKPVFKPVDHNEDIISSIASVPITMMRPPFKGSPALKEAGIPRANIAPSVEQPHGTQKDNWAADHAHESVLQQHVNFFCTTTPGVIYPWDTFYGFRRLGYIIPLCIFAVFIIHSNFSYPTLPPSNNLFWHFAPDPRFPIYVSRIHKDKHGSDSNTYDNEGRFVPQKFEEIFAKYASGDKQSLSKMDIVNYMKGQWDILDPIGWGGSLFEWIATYIFLWPEDGRIKKEDIRRIFDGSLFWEFERRNKEKEKFRDDLDMKRWRERGKKMI